jgi:hypothetical protein
LVPPPSVAVQLTFSDVVPVGVTVTEVTLGAPMGGACVVAESSAVAGEPTPFDADTVTEYDVLADKPLIVAGDV